MVKTSARSPLWMVCGLSVALVSCSSTSTAESGGGGNRPTRFLTVQPIQVCNDFGLLCADLALFEAETKKLWSQADIQVDFLSPMQLNGTRFLTIDSEDEFAELSFSGGAGAFGRHPLSTRTSGPVNMWFVERIFDGLFENLGWAWIDQNGVVISDGILAFNNGLGRRDTVAHELGHNLGLTHSNYGAGPANNLMSDGGVRNIPTSLSDITPDGARLGQLTNSQINFARASSLVESSPGPSNRSGPVGVPFPLPLLLDAAPDRTTADGASAPAIDAAGLPVKLAADKVPPPEVGKAANAPLLFAPEGLPPENLPPKVAPSAIQVAETEPVVQMAVQAEAALARVAPEAPQPIPDGSGMSLLSVGILTGYLWRQRRSP